MLENETYETFEVFFIKSIKQEGDGGSENSGKNPLSQTGCITGLPLKNFVYFGLCRISVSSNFDISDLWSNRNKILSKIGENIFPLTRT